MQDRLVFLIWRIYLSRSYETLPSIPKPGRWWHAL